MTAVQYYQYYPLSIHGINRRFDKLSSQEEKIMSNRMLQKNHCFSKLVSHSTSVDEIESDDNNSSARVVNDFCDNED